MKNSIKLTALLLLTSASIFAAVPSKTVVPAKIDAVTFSSLPANNGINIKVDEASTGKAIVIIYDQDGNVLRKDVMSNKKGFETAYILNKLDDGDYTIEVTADKQVVKKAIHVYQEGDSKMFIVKE